MFLAMQVLVIALVETLKNHVLSVMVLLVLLMYIAAIVAYHLFADVESLNLVNIFISSAKVRF